MLEAQSNTNDCVLDFGLDVSAHCGIASLVHDMVMDDKVSGVLFFLLFF